MTSASSIQIKHMTHGPNCPGCASLIAPATKRLMQGTRWGVEQHHNDGTIAHSVMIARD